MYNFLTVIYIFIANRRAGLSPSAKEEELEKDRIRKAAELYIKSKSKEFMGWTDPGQKKWYYKKLLPKWMSNVLIVGL